MAGLESFTGMLSGWGGGIGSATILLLNVLLVALVCYLIYLLFSYNIRVTVMGRDGILSRDSARLVAQKDNKRVKVFKLRKNKGWSGPLPRNFLTPIKGMFGRISYTAYFVEDKEGNLHPKRFVRKTGEWDGMTASDMHWVATEYKSTLTAISDLSWWERYASIIVPLFGFVVVGVVMIVMFRQMDSVAAAFNAAADKSFEAIRMAGGNSTQVIT